MTAMAAPVSAEGAATVGYRVYGYGPRRVLALHGLFGDGMSFTPMLSGFDPEQASFAFIDARGFGRSASLAGPYTLLTIAHDALAVADRLGWDRFSVMGQSMGGKAAIRLALAAPARVERIIGLAPIWAAPVPFEDAALARFRSSASNLDARAEIIAGSTGNRLPTCWSREIASAFFSSSHIEAHAGYLESFAFDDFAAEAAELDHPMLVVVGRHDLATTRMAHDGWRKMRRAEIVLLDECGHYPHVEVPLIAAALVGNFLDCGRQRTVSASAQFRRGTLPRGAYAPKVKVSETPPWTTGPLLRWRPVGRPAAYPAHQPDLWCLGPRSRAGLVQQKHVASLAGSPLTGRCFTPEEMANVLALLAFDQGGVIADGP